MTTYKIDMAKVLHWMHKGGEPDPAVNMPADTIILMDIALSLRTLIDMQAESMRINAVLMEQLNTDAESGTEH